MQRPFNYVVIGSITVYLSMHFRQIIHEMKAKLPYTRVNYRQVVLESKSKVECWASLIALYDQVSLLLGVLPV